MRLYHNPRCSKSRQAVELLKLKGVEFEEYRYLDSGIAEEDIMIIAALPNVIRTTEVEFKSNKFDLDNLDKVTQKLIEIPKLLQRPLLINGDKAVIGRPPDLILQLV
jgi:arsenate reductase